MSKSQCATQIVMFERAGHAVDFSWPGAGLLRDDTPSRRHTRDLLDDRTRLPERQRKIRRCREKQVERTRGFLKIDARRQDTGLEVGRHGIEIVGLRISRNVSACFAGS